jgi:hypothetical protein
MMIAAGYPEYKAEMQTNPGFGRTSTVAPTKPLSSPRMAVCSAARKQATISGTSMANPFPVQTAQTHTYTGAGSYQVGTINVGTCPVLSNTIVITPTGIVQNSSDFVLMQQRNQVILGVNSIHRDLRAEWYDISGRMLSSKAFGTVAEGSQLSIPKPSHSGLKLLRIITPESQRVFKVF